MLILNQIIGGQKKSVKSSIKEFRNIYCKSSYHEENVQKFITDIN